MYYVGRVRLVTPVLTGTRGDMMTTSNIPLPHPIPAAQYLRMSTEEQQGSIEIQKSAVNRYAQEHGFDIVRTYIDAGKSGVVLKYRYGLVGLLEDVKNGGAPFKAILVYDVSRWGRFQDTDEAAHYEFICQSSGIPVHYCAEEFTNDDSFTSSIFKALKRAMAAEFSRELGIKVFEGKKRISALGFRTGASAGYGFRRMLVSWDGKPKRILAHGEHKSSSTERVTLIPGPQREQKWVRWIFNRYAYDHKGVAEIVRELNQHRVQFLKNHRWHRSSVIRMLQNPKYTGSLVWGRTTTRLRTPVLRTPPKSWIVKNRAFGAIVDIKTFNRAQSLMGKVRSRNLRYTDGQMLGKLRHLLQTKSRLCADLIDDNVGPKTDAYIARFGGLLEAYHRVGYIDPVSTKTWSGRKRSIKLRREIVHEIELLFPKHVRTVRLRAGIRELLLVDNRIPVSVRLCCAQSTPLGHHRWGLRKIGNEDRLASLVCLLDSKNDAVMSYYVHPAASLALCNFQVRLKENDPWLLPAKKLSNLGEFYATVLRLEPEIPVLAANLTIRRVENPDSRFLSGNRR